MSDKKYWESLFVDLDIGEKIARITAAWDFSYGLPFPNWIVECVSCGSLEMKISRWVFHRKHPETGTPTPGRIDVMMKCTRCSYFHVWGLVVPWGFWEDHVGAGPGVTVTWREGLQILKGFKRVEDFRWGKRFETVLGKK